MRKKNDVKAGEIAVPDELRGRYLTDVEMCRLLRCSNSTLRQHLKDGPPRTRKAKSVDLRLCQPVYIGRNRLWPRDKVSDVMGVKL